MTRLDIDRKEIERRKQLQRDVWAYREVDHIPIHLWLMPYCSSKVRPIGHTVRELFEDPEIHYQINVERIERSLRVIPDDYIPFARMVIGYMVTATLFGVGVQWSDDPYQPPGSSGPILDDLEEVYGLERPTLDQGMVPELLQRLRYHAEHLPPEIAITGVNVGGPLQLCSDLIETNAFYTGFYENPDALHHLLELGTEVMLELFDAVVDAAGGLDRMTCVDWDPVWAPEGCKGHVCDDICSMISPRTFQEFGIPYNNRLYRPFGTGLLHNCGPHPAKHVYMDHDPQLKGVNCAYHFTRDDLSELGEAFAGRGIIEVSFDFGESAEEMVEGFRTMMETLAPDTVGIPLCLIGETWSDDEITDFYWEMRAISEEYAKAMRWRGAGSDAV